MEEHRRIIKYKVDELSYDEAVRIIAEWWELMKKDGVNVAAKVQEERAKWRSKEGV